MNPGMKRYQKLRAVIRHEYLTIIRQPAFWLSMLALPTFVGLSLGIGYLSDRNDDDVIRSPADYNIAVVDQSGVIQQDVAEAVGVGLDETEDTDELKARVRSAKLDGLIVYPKNIARAQAYQVFVNTDEQDDANKSEIVSSIAGYTLQRSLLAPIGSPDLIDLALSTDSWDAELTSYEDGEESPGFAAYVVPGAFIVLFYIVFFFSVGYAMTSVAEEKENRAIEMVLSYVRPRTLMVGKLLSVTLVAFTQILFFLAVAVAGYFIAKGLGNDLQLPFDINELVFDFQAILFGVLYLVSGFLLFIAMMLATGAAFPSAKEANSFLFVFYMLVFMPYIAFEAITKQPDSFLTQFASFFPLTAAPTLLLRNAFGSLGLAEALIGLAVLVVSTIAAIWLAGKLFKLGTLNFNSRVKLSSLFKKS